MAFTCGRQRVRLGDSKHTVSSLTAADEVDAIVNITIL